MSVEVRIAVRVVASRQCQRLVSRARGLHAQKPVAFRISPPKARYVEHGYVERLADEVARVSYVSGPS